MSSAQRSGSLSTISVQSDGSISGVSGVSRSPTGSQRRFALSHPGGVHQSRLLIVALFTALAAIAGVMLGVVQLAG